LLRLPNREGPEIALDRKLLAGEFKKADPNL
jgi:hypothetical protein